MTNMTNMTKVVFPISFFISFLALGCIFSSDEDRFHDHAGHLNSESFDVEINYGTVDIIADTIVSHLQGPSATIVLKSNSEYDQKVVFKLKNIIQSPLPESLNDRGLIMNVDENNTVLYSLTLKAGEEFKTTISTPQDTNGYSFGAVGDIQYNIEAAEKLSKDIADKNLAFMVILGDLVQRGTKKEYAWAYDFTSQFPVPVYVIYGNHDKGSILSDGYQYFRQYYGSTNTKFKFNGDLFLLLDAADQGLSASVFDFAHDALKSTSARSKFVFQHTPPFEESGFRNNSFNTSFSAARYINMMIDHDVDLILSGHIHTYQDFTIEGVRNLIVGTGGGIPERFDGYGNGYVIVNKNQEKDSFTVNRIEL